MDIPAHRRRIIVEAQRRPRRQLDLSIRMTNDSIILIA
jgi:hypothetical protein